MNRGCARLALLALLGALLAAPAAAATEAAQRPIDLAKLERERSLRAALYPVRPRISRYLEAAAKAVDKGQPADGLKVLDRLDPKRLNPYERALVYRMRAYLQYSSEDYTGALESFELVLAEEVLPVRDDNRIRFSMAQLHAALQQWREAIAAIHRWERYVEEPEPLAYYLLAVAHHQLNESDKALANAKLAVDRASEPAEAWLQLLAALYVQKQEYKNAQPILKELLARFTKKRYWVQYALNFAALEDYENALAVLRLAYLEGEVTEDAELRRLARASLHGNLPYIAAQILDAGLAKGAIEPDAKAFELLGNSWIAAREYERSDEPLQKAAKLATDGNLYVRLAQVHMQREQWKESVEALQQALAKGGLRDPGNVQLLLGIAYYNDNRVEQARSSFARAREHDSTREAADRWITHLEQAGAAG
jgi:hypothetical protein